MKANIAWINFVNSNAAANGIPFQAAWDQARQLKPDLFKMMMALGASRDAVARCNSQRNRSQGAASRADSLSEFNNEVQDYQKRFKVDYDTAWNTCSRRRPELFANAETQNWAGNGSIPSSANASSASNQTPTFCPTANLGTLGKLSLPANTTQQVFELCWISNGRQLATVNPAKIGDALVQHFMQEKSMTHDAAMAKLKAEFPDLWVEIERLSKQDQIRAGKF